MTVSEFIRATGLTRKALRHYEVKGLFLPSSRTVAGYRLYSEDQIGEALRIKGLRDEGYSIREILEDGEGLIFSTGSESLRFRKISRQIIDLDGDDLRSRIKKLPNTEFLRLFSNLTVSARSHILKVISEKGIRKMKLDLESLETKSVF